MTTFRSLTDAELAARHDRQPWVNIKTGQRLSRDEGVHAWVATSGDWRLDPRVECIPSRDPEPYCEAGFTNLRLRTRSEARPSASYAVWAPRPEFARPPVNPILTAYRYNPSAVLAVIITGEAEESDLDQYGDDTVDRALEWEPVELWADFYDHARKVLAKLAGVHA